MKKSILFILGVWCAISMQSQIKPYLQTPTSESIIVNWRTSTGAESKVYYGEEKEKLNQTVTGNASLLTGTKDNNYSYVYHTVKVNQLKPNTIYYYKVESGSEKSETHSFKTQPQLGEQGIYRFIILGDHQNLNDDRYIRLVKAAKSVAEEKYGAPIENHINLITNVGDQVDNGSLKQYDQVHFKQSEEVSPNLPIVTIIGNHETYGTDNPLDLYKKHFYTDEFEYKGIKSNSKYYYAMQQGRALFLMLSSEHPGITQTEWAKKVIDKAKTDADIDWIFSYNHRPLQAEQYTGDVSQWVIDEIMPMLNTTEKSVMNVSGHHHLYHRGQLRDYPTYHIISGGASWNQYWGQSGADREKDFDDVQKTIAYWPFQIVELNSADKSMSVVTYIIGNQSETLASPMLVDSFSRTFGKAAPNKPSINTLATTEIELPYTFESSAYSTSTDEEYNSVQFQIASDEGFTDLQFDLIRDYENLYGAHPAGAQFVDLHKGLDIFKQTINKGDLYNGEHYIRVRHRDRNVEWSEWSDAVAFTVKGERDGEPALVLNKDRFLPNENIDISYDFVPGDAGQWIGIYAQGKTPGGGAGNLSDAWKSAGGLSGSATLSIKNPGVYFAAIFRNGQYDILSKTNFFYVGDIPALDLDKDEFYTNEPITINYSNAPGLANDWIGIFKYGQVPGNGASAAWKYVSGENGSITLGPLSEGYYFISYCMQGKHFEPGKRVYISVNEALVSGIAEDEVKLNIVTDRASNLIQIDYPTGKGEQLGIYRIDGVCVKNDVFVNTASINSSELANGVYIFCVGEKTVKVLVR